MFFSYIWPIALIISANVIYQICAKSIPSASNVMVSLTITYFIGATISAILFFATCKGSNFLDEVRKLNYIPLIHGIAIIGLEVGYILAYKAGWEVNKVYMIASSVSFILLLLAGYFMFNEQVTLNKIIGIVVCLIGLIIANFK